MKRILSVRFSRAVNTYNRWAIPQRVTALKLARLLGNINGSVLDVGCGTGFLSEFLGVQGVIGIDISPAMAKYFAEKYGTAVIGDAERMPFKDKSFDWAVSSFSLHWTDMKRSLREMRRVSRKGIAGSIPVKGSIESSGFPFPDPEFIIEILESIGCYVLSKHIEIIDIPFKGLDLIRFFHYTGASYNPSAKVIFSRKKLMESANSMTRSHFRVLFFLCKIKS